MCAWTSKRVFMDGGFAGEEWPGIKMDVKDPLVPLKLVEKSEVPVTPEPPDEPKWPEEDANKIGTKSQEKKHEDFQSIFDFSVFRANGEEQKLDAYIGSVCIIVNVASE